jgi:hypothetical protein
MKKYIASFFALFLFLELNAQPPSDVIETLVVGKWKAIQKDKPDFVPDVFIDFSNLVEKKSLIKDAAFKIFDVKCEFYDFTMSKALIGASAEGTISVGFIQESYNPLKKSTAYLPHQGVIIADKMYITVYQPDRESISSWTFEKVKE